MSLSDSRLSYTDCYEAMDRALEDEKGIRVVVEDNNAATYYRMRLHQARKIDRRHNKSVYEPGDKLYGHSVYDVLIFRIREDIEGAWWVYMEQVTMPREENIESLSELGGEG